jgi:hypothetical protein
MNEPWALPPPEGVIGSIAMEAFRASGLDYPHTTVVTYFGHLRLSLLATGRFLTIHPGSLLKFPTKRPELKVLPIELPLAREPIGIVTLKNRTLSPTAQLFIEHAREVAKPLRRENTPARWQSRWRRKNHSVMSASGPSRPCLKNSCRQRPESGQTRTDANDPDRTSLTYTAPQPRLSNILA